MKISDLKIPPHSIEAEQAVLGGLLLANGALDRIADLLSEGDFYRQDHRLIWRSLVRLIEDNRPADVLTVAEVIGEALMDIGGIAYLHQLSAGTPSAANIRNYAEIVREKSQRRALISAATSILEDAYAPANSLDAVADEAQAKILAATRARGAGEARRISDVLAEVMNQLDERQRNPAMVTGTATGFADLDEMTAGLQDGDFIVLAGRPSMGKTALAMNIAEHVALEQRLPVLAFSMEMSRSQLVTRLLGAVGKVDAHKLRTGRLEAGDWDRLGVALGKLNEAPILIDETPGLTPMELRARARVKHREHGRLGLIVIDYLQLMQTAERSDNRANEVSEISRNLKSLARELNCPVLALSQLNRSLEARANKRPVMSDLRESGAIEADADVILFIYRDEVYFEDSPDKGIAEVIVGKQRNGPIGTIKLTFLGKHTRFENYSGAYGDLYGQPAARRKPPRRSFSEVE